MKQKSFLFSAADRFKSSFARWLVLCGLVIGAATTPLGAQDSEDLLEPDQAFAFSAQVISPEKVAVTWNIAPGYYMYLDKFSFDSDAAGITISDISYPPARTKQDEFFGDVQILEGSARIILNLSRSAPDSGQLQLTARGQGCNDPVGVCYAPIAHTVALILPETTAGQSSAINSVTDLQQLLGVAASGPEFLAAEEAFRLEARSNRRDTLIAQFFVAPGYYLYRDKLRFEMLAGATLEEHALPPGVSKQDPYFGEVTIFRLTLRPSCPSLLTPAPAK